MCSEFIYYNMQLLNNALPYILDSLNLFLVNNARHPQLNHNKTISKTNIDTAKNGKKLES